MQRPANTLTLGGPIAEFAPTGLTKIGPGELVLTAANAYSGATEVSQGTLNVRDPGALGTRSGTASVQRIITLSATQEGTFTLTFNGQSTTVNWGAFDVDVLAALESMSTIGSGNIASVTREESSTTTQGGPGDPQTGFVYTVTFGGTRRTRSSPERPPVERGAQRARGQRRIDVLVANARRSNSIRPVRFDGFAVAGQAHAQRRGCQPHTRTLEHGSNTWGGLIELLAIPPSRTPSSAIALSGGIAGVRVLILPRLIRAR